MEGLGFCLVVGVKNDGQEAMRHEPVGVVAHSALIHNSKEAFSLSLGQLQPEVLPHCGRFQ